MTLVPVLVCEIVSVDVPPVEVSWELAVRDLIGSGVFLLEVSSLLKSLFEVSSLAKDLLAAVFTFTFLFGFFLVFIF